MHVRLNGCNNVFMSSMFTCTCLCVYEFVLKLDLSHFRVYKYITKILDITKIDW
jgi:hypothetical protein